MDDRAIILPTLGQKFRLGTPRSGSSLWRIYEIYKIIRKYPSASYPLGQTMKNHPQRNKAILQVTERQAGSWERSMKYQSASCALPTQYH